MTIMPKVSNAKSEKSEKISIKSGFTKYQDNVLKDEVKLKSEIPDFKLQKT